MGKIKIGFVGTGYMGQKAHLANYSVLEECEVVALAEPRKEIAQKVSQRFNIPNVYENHNQLLENCDVDAIVAAQPYTHHISIVPDILKAKKPVLTEKPLSLSIEAGETLVELAKENDVLYMVGYHKRSDPAMEYAKKTIDEWKKSGEYGKMRYVRITMPPGDWIGGAGGALSSNEAYPPIVTEKNVAYFDTVGADVYNAFVNYYIHQVNSMRFLFGENYKLTFADRSGVLLAVESDSGVCGIIEMAPYSTSIGWQESLLISFERGYIKVELPAPLACQQAGKITIMKDDGKGNQTICQPIMPEVHAMRKQAINFIEAVKGQRPATCTAEEAVEDLKIAKQYISMFSQK